MNAGEKQLRAKVAKELTDAAKSIADSQGENGDLLAEEIWDHCARHDTAPATFEDPRTIAIVAYVHLAGRIARGEL